MAVLAPHEARRGTRARALQRAVRKTLLYSDLFDFPLTAAELCTFLFDVGASRQEVMQAARGGSDVVEVAGYFCLKGREHLAVARERGRDANDRLWARARRYTSALAAIPFVRMVAITGSLAPRNARPHDDIDLLIVVRPGRLWLCRLLVLVLVRAVRLLGDELCPNFMLTESQLQIDGAAFPAYYARELTQMMPLFGRNAYQALRLANGWTSQLIPNSNHVLRSDLPDWPPGWTGVLKRVSEFLLALPILDRFEALERRRKIARLLVRHEREHGIVEFSQDRCRGHFGTYIERMMRLFELRCAAIADNDS